MKTEQEQIEEIVKILLEATKKCFDTDCNHCDYQYEKDCNQYRKALALVQAGYGDVSEYKAEIKRLKADIDHQIDATNDAENLADHLKYVLDKTRKQAKIDVLNKVKNCREATDSDCYPYLERIVNKLIKEVENEQKD